MTAYNPNVSSDGDWVDKIKNKMIKREAFMSPMCQSLEGFIEFRIQVAGQSGKLFNVCFIVHDPYDT